MSQKLSKSESLIVNPIIPNKGIVGYSVVWKVIPVQSISGYHGDPYELHIDGNLDDESSGKPIACRRCHGSRPWGRCLKKAEHNQEV